MEGQERIELEQQRARVRVWADDIQLANSTEAVELRETGYPPRQYLPPDDVATEWLRQTGTRTRCPFKGEATYYSVALGSRTIEDAVWCYHTPFEPVRGIAGHFCFDPGKVRVQLN